jgi:hypothetical protein
VTFGVEAPLSTFSRYCAAHFDSLRLLGAAAAIFFPRFRFFFRVFYLLIIFKADRWLFLIGLAVPEERAAPRTTTTQIAQISF